MVDINISYMNNSDYDALRKLFFKVRKETFSWLDEDKFDLYDFDKMTEWEIIFVARIECVIVGFVSIWKKDRFIHNLFVDKEYRGLGVANKLIKRSVSEVGLPLTLKCLDKNKFAMKYYLNNGWEKKEKGICEDGEYYLFEYK